MTTDARVMEAWERWMGKGNSGHYGLEYYEPGFKAGYESAMAEIEGAVKRIADETNAQELYLDIMRELKSPEAGE